MGDGRCEMRREKGYSLESGVSETGAGIVFGCGGLLAPKEWDRPSDLSETRPLSAIRKCEVLVR